MSQHTPQPWEASGSLIFRRLDNGLTETIAGCRGHKFGDDCPNAKLIVQAVNAHEELLAALHRYVEADAGTFDDDLHAAALAAIAKAEGEQR